MNIRKFNLGSYVAVVLAISAYIVVTESLQWPRGGRSLWDVFSMLYWITAGWVLGSATARQN